MNDLELFSYRNTESEGQRQSTETDDPLCAKSNLLPVPVLDDVVRRKSVNPVGQRDEARESTFKDRISLEEKARGGQQIYPNSPGFRRSGTSEIAAEAVTKKASLVREKCLEALKRGPMTPDEIGELVGHSAHSCRSRISELKASGKVKETGQRRANTSGFMADVVELV